MPDETDRQIVWDQTVDNSKYVCRVERTGVYTGELVVSREGTEILREQVGLSYQAIFGPDMDDVAQWRDSAIKAIDADYAARGEEVPKG